MEELGDLYPDSSQADLETENIPDGMDGEQTWPTEEELRQVDASETTVGKRTLRIPKGTSDYQAAWIMEDAGQNKDEKDQENEDDEDSEGDEEDEDMREPPELKGLEEEGENDSQQGSYSEEGEVRLKCFNILSFSKFRNPFKIQFRGARYPAKN